MTITNPTAEQVAIFSAMRETNDHLLIDAKAGSGKTSTIVAGLHHLRGTSLLAAFNRSIADELKLRVQQEGFAVAARTQTSTVHSHGLSAFRKAGRKPQTLSGKLHFMLKDQIASYSSCDPIHKNARHVVRLCSLAKAHGFGLSGGERFPALDDEDGYLDLIEHFNMEEDLEGGFSADSLIEEAVDLLRSSNVRVNSIDFDDMIYLPLLLDLPLTQYNNVLIDEAQDINTTRREMMFRSMKPGGRIIAVGDPNQAIYGFTGASVDSLDAIRRRCKTATTLPLSTCWRCDGDIIREAQHIVPTIKARPNAPSGLVRRTEFRTDKADFLSEPQPGDAILCRLNKPNVAVALGLLRRGKPARIEGRDLGKKLLDHVRKADDSYAFQRLDETLISLAAYKENETQKLLRKNREAAIPLLEDEVDAAELLIERCLELRQVNFTDLEALVNSLFGDEVSSKNTITLSSIHKAKGREWPRVFILGRFDYMPFFRATQDWELEQEHNLIYVAVTRAEKELVYVTGVAAALDKNLHREAALQVQVKETTSAQLAAETQLELRQIETAAELNDYFNSIEQGD